MPYSVKKVGGKFQVVTTDTGKVHGTHSSKEAAVRQMRAIYANAPPESEGKAKEWAEGYRKRVRRKE